MLYYKLYLKKMKDNKTIYAWACDIENYRGEGILGINFLKQLSYSSNKKIFVESPTTSLLIDRKKIKILKTISKTKINFGIFSNYLNPFYGVFKILTKKKNYCGICYVNFLPLWNFVLFMLLPKQTILGPITGSVYKKKINDINSIFRKYLIPIFYFISIKLISKNKYLLFSTSLLKRYCSKLQLNKCYFDYNLINYQENHTKFEKKKIDILFYYRKYKAHDSSKQSEIIKQLSKTGYNIYVVGDQLNIKNDQNLGIIKRDKLFNYLKKTKFTINEATNFFSIFSLDAISCGVRVFNDFNIFIKQSFFNKKYFIKIDLDNTTLSFLKIKYFLNNYKKLPKNKFNINKFKKRYSKYFTNQIVNS